MIASRSDARSLFDAAVAAVDPECLVARCLSASAGRACIRAPGLRLTLERERLWIAAVGKAAVAMARGAASRLPGVRGIAIAPRPRSRSAADRPQRVGAIEIAYGEHPVPGRGSFAATRRLVEAIAGLPENAVVLLLLSGGASALLAMPAPGILEADEVRLNRALLRSGLPVDRMNAVRKSVSAVKGGGLARLAAPRSMITLAISDVPGDALSTIGSGPGIPQAVPRRVLAAALRRLDRRDVPASVRRRLASPDARQRRGGPAPPVRASVIGSNAVARRAAAARARALGYSVRPWPRLLAGAAGRCGFGLARALPREPRRPTAVIAGGETVVDARGASGRGGRSQELALAAATALAGTRWLLLAAGTDGIDGQTPAAGAIVDGGTLGRSGVAAARRALAEHDSYGYFARWGGLVITGPTGTNAMDLVIALHPGAAPRGGRASGRVVRAREIARG